MGRGQSGRGRQALSSRMNDRSSTLSLKYDPSLPVGPGGSGPTGAEGLRSILRIYQVVVSPPSPLSPLLIKPPAPPAHPQPLQRWGRARLPAVGLTAWYCGGDVTLLPRHRQNVTSLSQSNTVGPWP